MNKSGTFPIPKKTRIDNNNIDPRFRADNEPMVS
jgi:hypothetical protein